MQHLIEAIDLHAPGGLAEALLLVVCLSLTFESGRRMGGWSFAGLLTLASSSGFFLVGHIAIPVTVTVVAVAAAARRPRPTVSAISFLLQIGLLAGGMILYQLGRIGTRASWEPARDNGLRVLDFERSLGLYVEPDVQDTLMSTRWVMEAVNAFYSYGFLAVVAAVLVYVFIVDRENYTLMRNALGISVALAVITIGLYPTAPPRLLAEAGLLDTVVVEGREHNFTNEYAAIPSLHVGWMVLSGYIIARVIGGRLGATVGVLPGAAMMLTVIATGNHFWVDGAIGTAYSLGPALALAHVSSNLRSMKPSWLYHPGLHERLTLALSRRKARVTIAAMVALLTYLIVGQLRAPGFTDHWGYLVGQTFAIVWILIGLELILARQGGISWPTHLIATSALYLDVLGTDGNLYANIDEYDKLVHFMGIAAVTACAYELFNGLHRAGSTSRFARDRLLAALTLGTLVGIGWEVYEFFGDKIFDSYRVQSRWDTANDLVSDFLGGITVVAIFAWMERAAAREATERQRPPEGAHAHHEGRR